MTRFLLNHAYSHRRTVLVFCALLGLLPEAHASRTQRWQQATFADFADGTLQGISIDSEGNLMRGPVAEKLADLGVQRIWTLLDGPDGTLFVGTGDDGKVIRVDSSGEVIWTFDSPEISVHALLLGEDGHLYAGTAPGGLIYRIDASSGEARTFSRTGSHYVWDLQLDARGRMLAATGEPGRVLVVQPDGGVHALFDAPERHVMCLAWRGRTLLAGTAGGARIYALPERGDGVDPQLLYDAEQEEVHRMVVLPDGDVLASLLPDVPGGGQGPSAGLYRLTTEGGVYPVWLAPAASTLALTLDADGQPVVATDDPSRVSRLDADGEEQIILDLNGRVAAALHATANGGLVIGDAQSGRIYRAGPGAATEGEYISTVRDFGTHARWGRLSWTAHVPRRSRIEIYTRSGNTEEPDATWSEWSEPLTQSGQNTQSPPARFLQYRVRLTGSDADDGPVVHRVVVYGRQSNLPPRITDLRVEPYRPRQRDNAAQDPAQAAIQRAVERRRPPHARSLFLIHWQASDPNGDNLVYSLYLKGEGQTTWKLLEEQISGSSVLWDTVNMPEGMTRLKLIASDAPDNPPAETLETRRISQPFAIDNSPPVITLEVDQRQDVLRVQARMVDRVSPVVRAEYSVNYQAQAWQIEPVEGLLDSREEFAEFEIHGLDAGEHVIVVRAWDQLDNVGTAQIVVRLK